MPTPLEKAKDIISNQHEMLEGIVNQHYSYGIVLSLDHRQSLPAEPDDNDYLPSAKNKERTCVLIHNGQKIEVVYTKKQQKDMGLKPGDTVKCVTTRHGVGMVEKMAEPVSLGPMMHVKEVAGNFAEVEADGRSRSVHVGSVKDLEKGCVVILDETGTIIMRNAGKPKAQYTFTGNTGISWNDIGGLETVKSEIQESIENPIKFSALYTAYGRKPTKGILLYGPPGNGKTMIGKAVATSIAELYNTKESGFIYIKGPEILNMYVGASEERIRNIFASAREFKQRNGCPAIIFIDEAEAILSKRGSGKSSDVDKTIVPQFLTEMDGLDEASAIVILTTNRPDMLDSAIIREGRIDKKIKVPRPTQESVETIFNINLKKVPCTIEPKNIAKSAAKLVFDTNLCLYNITLKSGKTMKFCMSHIINGAMVTAIINDAITSAINRDLIDKKDKPTGVTMDDVHDSVLKTFSQNSRMNHEHHFEDLTYELLTEHNDEIASIKPVKVKEKTADVTNTAEVPA